MSEKKVITANSIVELFGKGTKLYVKISENIHNQIENNKKLFHKKLGIWKKIFHPIYETKSDKELFLDHLIYSNILYVILLIRISKKNHIQFKKIYNQYKTKDFEIISDQIIDLFKWIKIQENIFKEIYDIIVDTHLGSEDLFHSLYQQIFQSSIRHLAGEFYTPSKLVEKMVSDTYKFGKKVLDPSCGSGNFLMEIISRIIKSEKPINSKYEALNNLFGFDINPLAIYTLKINVILILHENFSDINLNKFDLNFYVLDSLFPENSRKDPNLRLKNIYNSFDLIIGNPPWLTYKDIYDKAYQKNIRKLADTLNIKPKSQYITHIELATIFFYAIPKKFSKINGIIFFVITKSVINGDHCRKFRSFKFFNNLEIWDFPDDYNFNVNHVCIKAKYIGEKKEPIQEKYPILTKIFDAALNLKEELLYSSLKLEEDGALLLLPQKDLDHLSNFKYSRYKDKFYQGATLVPRPLIFFQVTEKKDNILIISSSKDILSRSKNKWRFEFKNKKIEENFRYKTFLNKDLVPFFLKRERDVFLPIDLTDFDFKINYLQKFPQAFTFYKEMNEIYKSRKKATSDINTLFSNLNYWNKLTKQKKTEPYLVIYNASGSYLKSAVIEQFEKKIIVGSENYYYATDQKNEAYYLTAILNSPILTKYIKMIKSSRHIHKRPFSFPIPIYDNKNESHYKLAHKGKKYTSYAHDIVYNNPKITPRKIRMILNQNLKKLDPIARNVLFNQKIHKE
ncbi:MAG: N-6 DNA methylase [Promethearchaeati archaeon]